MQTDTAPGQAQPAGGRHAHDRRVRVPLPVWAAVGVNIAVMIVFSLLYPAYYEFDETAHVSRVLATQNGLVLPTPGHDPYVTAVAISYARYGAPDLQPFVNYTPLPRNQRPTMGHLGGAAAYQRNLTLPEQLSQHPPGYYLLGAGVLDAIPLSSHLAWDKIVWLLRLMDIVLMAPLPLIAWAVSRRFARRGVAIAMAFAPLSIPGLERLGGAVTNDDLLILLTSVFILLLARVLGGDRRTSTGVLMGLTIAVSLLVKGFALVFPLVAVIAYVVAWRRQKPVPWPPVIAVLVGSALGGAWWVHNVIVFGVVQPGGLTVQEANTVWPPLPNGETDPLSSFVRKASDELTTDFWGALGLANPPSLPGVLTVLATALLLLFVLVGLIVPAAASRLHGRRLDLVVLLLPTVLIACIVLVHGADSFRTTGTLAGIQGRYFYYGLIAILACCARGIDVLLDRAPALDRAMPAIACVVGLALSGTAFWIVIIKLWLPGNDSPRHYLPRVARSIGAHSPWPKPVTVGLFGLCAVAAIVALVAAVASRSASTRPAVTQPDPLSA
jgi:small subunit ribosomal protein S36